MKRNFRTVFFSRCANKGNAFPKEQSHDLNGNKADKSRRTKADGSSRDLIHFAPSLCHTN